jgi:hypothetical protein
MDNLTQTPLTMCVSKATLAASGAATTFSTTGATLYCIKGKAYTTSAAASAATPTSDAALGTTFAANTLAANQGTVFVWCYDGSSTTAATAIKVCQGTEEALDALGAFINAPQFPGIPDTLAPFAYTVVKNGSTGSAWTFGTSNWNATGITLAHQDVMTLPARPQVS